MNRSLAALCAGSLTFACITVEAPSVTKAYAAHSAARHDKGETLPLPNLRFRTNEPEGAVDRARVALVQQCGALDETASQSGTLLSTWQRTDYRTTLQRYHVRCSVGVLPNPSDDSADVQVAVDVLACNRVKSTDDGLARNVLDPSEVERSCSKVGHAVSVAMAQDLMGRANRIQEAVFRR